jgi:hypothetical protein
MCVCVKLKNEKETRASRESLTYVRQSWKTTSFKVCYPKNQLIAHYRTIVLYIAIFNMFAYLLYPLSEIVQRPVLPDPGSAKYKLYKAIVHLL